MKHAPRKVYIRENGGYIELSYTDFCRRRQADQSYADRLFIPIQGCLLEVVREQYADFYKDKERWSYLQKLDTSHSLLSLAGFTDSVRNVADFIVDEAVDVAESVVNAVMVDRLKAALPLLLDGEQALVRAIFFEELSEREVGLRLGVAQSVVNKRKARILAKLRKMMENKILRRSAPLGFSPLSLSSEKCHFMGFTRPDKVRQCTPPQNKRRVLILFNNSILLSF